MERKEILERIGVILLIFFLAGMVAIFSFVIYVTKVKKLSGFTLQDNLNSLQPQLFIVFLMVLLVGALGAIMSRLSR